MTDPYVQVRRQWKDVDPERDLKNLWATERFEDAAKVHEALRVTELAIRVAGWETVRGWAREQIAKDAVLRAHLVELSMRALEQKDDAFLTELTATLLARSPSNYFHFWLALFTARHAHRGERIFRDELTKLSDYHAVKYRRWLRKIFRKLRFRCNTPREKALGAVAFSLPKAYQAQAYRSEIFDAYFEALKSASTWVKTKSGKNVTGARQAEIFTPSAVALGVWSLVEGIRTSARIPRTLGYLAAMAPKMTDTELRRALRAFDAHLGGADHKKAPEEVVACADYLRSRLVAMPVTLDEWSKILPYTRSPVLVRVLEELVGVQLQGAITWARESTGYTAVPVIDANLDARGYRAAFLVGYVLQQAREDAEGVVIDGEGGLHVLGYPSALWPYGTGLEPPARRWTPEPDHPHRVGLTALRETFPVVAKRAKPQARPLDCALRALRWHLWRRATVEGGPSEGDVPVLFLPNEPSPEEMVALGAVLDCFSAAVLALFDDAWYRTLDRAHVRHCTLPRDVRGAMDVLGRETAKIAEVRASFAGRREAVARAVRALLLAPPPAVHHWVRVPAP